MSSLEEQLWNASRAGDHSAVQRALDQGADVQAVFGKASATALHQACCYGHSKIIRALLAAGAKTDAKTLGGQTPLYWACTQGRVDAIRILVLEADANIEAKENDGSTALHFAVYSGRLDIVGIFS